MWLVNDVIGPERLVFENDGAGRGLLVTLGGCAGSESSIKVSMSVMISNNPDLISGLGFEKKVDIEPCFCFEVVFLTVTELSCGSEGTRLRLT